MTPLLGNHTDSAKKLLHYSELIKLAEREHLLVGYFYYNWYYNKTRTRATACNEVTCALSRFAQICIIEASWFLKMENQCIKVSAITIYMDFWECECSQLSLSWPTSLFHLFLLLPSFLLFFNLVVFSPSWNITESFWSTFALSISLSAVVSACVSLFLLQCQPPLRRKPWWIQRHCSATKLTTWRADPCRDAPLIVAVRVFVSFRIKKNDAALVRFSGLCGPASTICP